MINPLAGELNKIILKSNHNIFKMLTDLGKKLYFPKGILRQTTEADKKASYYNTTIGIAKENGETMHLDSIMNHFWDISPEEALPYAPALGMPELREKWQEKLFCDNPGLNGKKISKPLVTSGITHGLSLTADLFVSYGDVVLLPDKLWGNYDVIFSVRRGANIQKYSILSADSSGFDLDNFRENLLKCAPRGKIVVILNFPNNPTGYSITVKEAESIRTILTEVAEKGCNIVVVCDDAYFGFFYEDNVYKESIFSLLADHHERILAVKLDGATNEMYVWGFRTGFITFSTITENNMLFEALEEKYAGAIRCCISNCATHSQTIVLNALEDLKFKNEKEKKFSLLRERASAVKNILKHEKFSSVWEPYPFNSGYFMCIKLKEIDAEIFRTRLLENYGIGVIAAAKNDIRISFSCIDKKDLSDLFEKMYECACILKYGVNKSKKLIALLK